MAWALMEEISGQMQPNSGECSSLSLPSGSEGSEEGIRAAPIAAYVIQQSFSG